MPAISHMPSEALWSLRDLCKIDKGECFTNCGLAVLLSEEENNFSLLLKSKLKEISYVLGFLYPPKLEREPHAWLEISDENNSIYWDPTLQVHSRQWGINSTAFKYERLFLYSKADLKQWFSTNYPNRTFDKYGIPNGHCRFPIIDKIGNLQPPESI